MHIFAIAHNDRLSCSCLENIALHRKLVSRAFYRAITWPARTGPNPDPTGQMSANQSLVMAAVDTGSDATLLNSCNATIGFCRPCNQRYPSRPGSSGLLENNAILLP